MKSFLLLLFIASTVWAGRPRVPVPDTPDLVHQNDQDLIDQIDNLARRTNSPPTDLTIVGGTVTINSHFHVVDTESSASTDDLDTIDGGKPGDTIILQAKDNARTVVIKDSTGNLNTVGDFSLDSSSDTITLIRASTTTWHEVARSNNG